MKVFSDSKLHTLPQEQEGSKQLLQHQVRGDLVHLHENDQHPPEEAGVGDGSGGHLDQLIVRAGNTFLQTAGHTEMIW